jgi:hypothetical protein
VGANGQRARKKLESCVQTLPNASEKMETNLICEEKFARAAPDPTVLDLRVFCAPERERKLALVSVALPHQEQAVVISVGVVPHVLDQQPGMW